MELSTHHFLVPGASLCVVCLPPVVTFVSLPFLPRSWLCSGWWRSRLHTVVPGWQCLAWRWSYQWLFMRETKWAELRERGQKPGHHLFPQRPRFTSSCFSFSICWWKEWHMISSSQSVRNIFVKYQEMLEGAWEWSNKTPSDGQQVTGPIYFFNWKRFLYLKKYLYFFIYQWMLSHETHCNGRT